MKEKSRNIRFGKTLLCALLMVVFMLMGGCGEDEKKLQEASAKMKQYLDAKYGKEFVIKEIKTYCQSLGGREEFVAQVYSMDDKDLIFEVRRYENEKLSAPRLYREWYLNEVWSKQKKDEVESLLKEIFGFLPKYEFGIYPSDEFVNSVNGEVPELKNVLSKNSDEINIGISVSVKESYNEKTQMIHAERIFRWISYVRELGVKDIYISYGIDISEQKNEYNECNCSLNQEEVATIQEPKDVIQYFEKYARRK